MIEDWKIPNGSGDRRYPLGGSFHSKSLKLILFGIETPDYDYVEVKKRVWGWDAILLLSARVSVHSFIDVFLLVLTVSRLYV